jgi:hypothetical protein
MEINKKCAHSQGYTWASQAAIDFQIPSQASLHSESTPCFLSSYPVYLGNPWLKIFSREEAQSSYALCNSGGTWK